MVEFALIQPILWGIILGFFVLIFLAWDRDAVLHAAREAAVAGAQEPAEPRRCDVAEQTYLQVFQLRVPSDFRCTGIGSAFTVTVTDPYPLLFTGATWNVTVNATAVVRR